MKVKEVMSNELHGVRADATLADAAERMRTLDVGSLPVVAVNENRLVGILTDRDIVVRSIARGKDAREQKVEEIMSQSLVCCNENDELEDASKTMKSKQVRRTLVLNDAHEPVGMLSLGDLAKSTIDKQELSSLVRYVSTPEGGSSVSAR